MKKSSIKTILAILLISIFGLQSCIGSFSLTNRVLTWNKQVSSKFVNELVFFAFWILPVYEVTSVADLLVLNSIEFWSGNKPLEAGTKIIESDHGEYILRAYESGYELTSPDGVTINFDFDTQAQEWSFSKDGSEKTVFLKFIDDNNVQIISNDGEFVDVELSEKGITQYMTSISTPCFAAL